MTTTTNEFGQQNIFAKEPPIIMTEVTVTHNEKAEKLNGRFAMIGVIAALVLTHRLDKLSLEFGNG